MEQLCKDLNTFNNPEDLARITIEALTGLRESLSNYGVAMPMKEIKKACGFWRILPYKFIPKRVKAISILKLIKENNK